MGCGWRYAAGPVLNSGAMAGWLAGLARTGWWAGEVAARWWQLRAGGRCARARTAERCCRGTAAPGCALPRLLHALCCGLRSPQAPPPPCVCTGGGPWSDAALSGAVEALAAAVGEAAVGRNAARWPPGSLSPNQPFTRLPPYRGSWQAEVRRPAAPRHPTLRCLAPQKAAHHVT